MSKRKDGIEHVWGELVVTIFRLNSLFLDIGNEISGKAGQTSARWSVLASVYLMPQSVAHIARRMGLTRQSVQRTADLLVKDGLAIYVENIHHKRAKLVQLTQEGNRAMEKIVNAQKTWVRERSSKLDLSRIKGTLECLNDLEAICRG